MRPARCRSVVDRHALIDGIGKIFWLEQIQTTAIDRCVDLRKSFVGELQSAILIASDRNGLRTNVNQAALSENPLHIDPQQIRNSWLRIVRTMALATIIGSTCIDSHAAQTAVLMAGSEPVYPTAIWSPGPTPASCSICTTAAAKFGLTDACLDSRCPTMLVTGLMGQAHHATAGRVEFGI